MSTILTLDNAVDDIAGTNTSSYTDAQKHRAFTRWAYALNNEVADSMDDWDFQGEISTADLVANQREYTFPSDIFKIKRIDLKLDGTNWTPTIWLDESEVGNSIASESDITNKFNNASPSVSLFDKSYFVWSGTIAAVTGGIKIWYTEDIVGVDDSGDDLTAFTADGDTPNLIEFAQMALVYGAALDYGDKHNDEALSRKMNMKLYGNPYGRPAEGTVGGLVGRIRNFYSTRVPDRQMMVKTSSSLEEFE